MKGAPATLSVTRAPRQRLKRIRSPDPQSRPFNGSRMTLTSTSGVRRSTTEQIGTGNSPEDRSAPLPETPRTLSRA